MRINAERNVHAHSDPYTECKPGGIFDLAILNWFAAPDRRSEVVAVREVDKDRRPCKQEDASRRRVGQAKCRLERQIGEVCSESGSVDMLDDVPIIIRQVSMDADEFRIIIIDLKS